MSLELRQAGLSEYWLTAFPKPSAHQRCCNGLSTALKLKPYTSCFSVPYCAGCAMRRSTSLACMAATASSYLTEATPGLGGRVDPAVAVFSLALISTPSMSPLTTTAVLPAPSRVTLTCTGGF